MVRRRIGNDIGVEWTVYRNDVLEDFTGKTVEVTIRERAGKKQPVSDVTISGSTVIFTWKAENQYGVGSYSFILEEFEGGRLCNTVDISDAVELVPHTYLEDGDEDYLADTSVTFRSELIVVNNSIQRAVAAGETAETKALTAEEINVLLGNTIVTANDVYDKLKSLLDTETGGGGGSASGNYLRKDIADTAQETITFLKDIDVKRSIRMKNLVVPTSFTPGLLLDEEYGMYIGPTGFTAPTPGGGLTEIPVATADALGGIKTGYIEQPGDHNYAVQIRDDRAYVHVPLQDMSGKADAIHDHDGQLIRPKTFVVPATNSTEGLRNGETSMYIGPVGFSAETPGGGLSEIPVASETVLGGFRTGFQEGGRNYAVRMQDQLAYVHVPGQDLSAYALKSELANYLPLIGGNLTGGLSVGYSIKPVTDAMLDVNGKLKTKTFIVPTSFTASALGTGEYGMYIGTTGFTAATPGGGLSEIPVATNDTLGGFKTGYAENGRNYAVNMLNGRAFVHVPEQDLSGYLPLTGGTLVGVLNFNSSGESSISQINEYLSLSSKSNEICISGISDTEIIVNYKKNHLGYAPQKWFWFAGSSSEYANFSLGNLVAHGYIRTTDSAYIGYATGSSSTEKLCVYGDSFLEGTLRVSPFQSSGVQDGIILHDRGTGGSEGLKIKWTSASFTNGIAIYPNGDLSNLCINGKEIYHSGNLIISDFAKNILGESIDVNAVGDGLFGGKLQQATGTLPSEKHRWGAFLSCGGSGYAFEISAREDNNIYNRISENGTWYDWHLFYHSGNSNQDSVSWSCDMLYTRSGIDTKNDININKTYNDAVRNFKFNVWNDAANISAFTGSSLYNLRLGTYDPNTNYALFFDATTKNWGIGTETPQAKFDVQGSAIIGTLGGCDIWLRRNANNYIRAGLNGQTGGAIVFSVNGGDYALALSGNTNAYFYGSVGIGRDAQAKLDVNGDFKCSTLYIPMSAPTSILPNHTAFYIGETGFTAETPGGGLSEIPVASDDTLGGFKTGYQGGERDFAVCMQDQRAYVHVPAQDLSGYLPKSGGAISGSIKIMPKNETSQQEGILLHDAGGGLSEGLYIKWTSSSYTNGVTLSPNSDLTNLRINDAYILHAGNYSDYALPLSGGIMSGKLSIRNADDAKIALISTDGSYSNLISFEEGNEQGQSVQYGYIYFKNDSSNLVGYGDLKYNNNTVYHSGNLNPSDFAKNILDASFDADNIGNGLYGGKVREAAGSLPSDGHRWGAFLSCGAKGFAFEISARGDNNIYNRIQENGTWHDWHLFYHSGNYILGVKNVASESELLKLNNVSRENDYLYFNNPYGSAVTSSSAKILTTDVFGNDSYLPGEYILKFKSERISGSYAFTIVYTDTTTERFYIESSTKILHTTPTKKIRNIFLYIGSYGAFKIYSISLIKGNVDTSEWLTDSRDKAYLNGNLNEDFNAKNINSSTLSTTSTATIGGLLTANAGLTVSNGLSVTGASTFSNGLTVNGEVLKATVGLDVGGDSSFIGLLSAQGGMQVSGTSSFLSGLTINGGTLTANAGLSVNNVFSVDSNGLQVSVPAMFYSGLDVYSNQINVVLNGQSYEVYNQGNINYYGRNLLKQTATGIFFGKDNFSKDDGFYTIYRSGGAYESTISSTKFTVDINKTYTISIEAKGNHNNMDMDIYLLSNGSSYVQQYKNFKNVTTSWKKFVYTFKPDASFNGKECYIRIDNNRGDFSTDIGTLLCIRNIKMEESSLATDWSPAWEDKADLNGNISEDFNAKSIKCTTLKIPTSFVPSSLAVGEYAIYIGPTGFNANI